MSGVPTAVHVVFLVIFAATALVTLGGITRIPPFHRIKDSYVKWLATALVGEVVVSVVAYYNVLTSPDPLGKHYGFTIRYQDYLEKVRDCQPKNEKDCLEQYVMANTQVEFKDQTDDVPIRCRQIIERFKHLSNYASPREPGVGEVILKETPNPNKGTIKYYGIASYRFPNEKSKTPMVFEGIRYPDEEILVIKVTQSSRYVKTKGGKFKLEDAPSPYPIRLREAKDGLTFTGELIDKRDCLEGVSIGIVDFDPK